MVLSKSVDEYKTKIAEIFNARIDYSCSEIHARVADRLVQLAAPQPSEKVLDIATGTGFVAISVARLVGESGKVVGVDISAGMLKQAEQAVSAASLSNIELVLTDAETLDYAAGSFDLICCCNALPYMSNVPAALRHWQSLLRPGGRLAFNCWSEQSYVTGRLLRTFAARYGIHVAVVGHDTGTPERCHAVLAGAGYTLVDVVGESTGKFYAANQLDTALDSAVKNPIYGITQNGAKQLSFLRREYLTEARSPSVWNSINAEVGAYFVLAQKPFP